MKKLIGFILFVCFFFLLANSQEKKELQVSDNEASFAENRGDFRIMCYNVENLFDIENDSIKNDDEFMPEGAKHWTKDKYYKKIHNIYKVIMGVGGWEPPEIVGFCEVENDKVLQDLTERTPISKFNYKVIHFESPDSRGIDVAMLYRPNKFTPIHIYPIPVIFPNSGNKSTRDILFVTGVTKNNDTLHIFINHWPSRWGGQLESEPRRVYVASIVRGKVDSILTKTPNANIIIMGDLNDGTENKSVIETLRANTKFEKFDNSELYNLTHYLEKEKGLGSHKYNGEWGILDHAIVSGSLLNKTNNVYTSKEDAHIFNAPFLLEKDDANFGYKPFRTYIGYKFNNGFSDHLPVFIDLRWKKD